MLGEGKGDSERAREQVKEGRFFPATRPGRAAESPDAELSLVSKLFRSFRAHVQNDSESRPVVPRMHFVSWLTHVTFVLVRFDMRLGESRIAKLCSPTTGLNLALSENENQTPPNGEGLFRLFVCFGFCSSTKRGVVHFHWSFPPPPQQT